jgi:hypothetical protein
MPLSRPGAGIGLRAVPTRVVRDRRVASDGSARTHKVPEVTFVLQAHGTTIYSWVSFGCAVEGDGAGGPGSGT